MRSRRWMMLCACCMLLLAGWTLVQAGPRAPGDEPAAQEPKRNTATAIPGPAERAAVRAWTTAVDPKPLSANVKKGLAWLVEHQLPSGGWGQGEEAPTMRGTGGETLRDQPNVADTCIGALALIRSGSTPVEGPYKNALAKAVRWVVGEVEASDSQSIAVTSVQGTRVQQKLGPNIDTFLASMLLAEVKGKVAETDSARVDAALAKVLDKIRRHQKDDGSFDGGGWAPVLAQAMCGKGINRARQAGAAVPQQVIARAQNSAQMAFARTATTSPATPAAGGRGGLAGAAASSRPAVGAGAAGVELYEKAANLGVLQESVNTERAQVSELRDKAVRAKDADERTKAKVQLEAIARNEKTFDDAQRTVIDRLGDKEFTAGFGSNGGEEFLSYMNISESLVVKGGNAWKQWDAQISRNLNHVQNDDGSWSGHHCITGRTFCTSAALLVLMADRTPVPVDAKHEVHAKSE